MRSGISLSQFLRVFLPTLTVDGDVFDSVFLCCPFSHEVSWMRSGTSLSQFLRVFLPTLTLFCMYIWNIKVVLNKVCAQISTNNVSIKSLRVFSCRRILFF